MGFPDPVQLAEQQQQINRQMQRRPTEQRAGCLILFIFLALFLILVAAIAYVAINALQSFP
jgi:hypothetical protein